LLVPVRSAPAGRMVADPMAEARTEAGLTVAGETRTAAVFMEAVGHVTRAEADPSAPGGRAAVAADIFSVADGVAADSVEGDRRGRRWQGCMEAVRNRTEAAHMAPAHRARRADMGDRVMVMAAGTEAAALPTAAVDMGGGPGTATEATAEVPEGATARRDPVVRMAEAI